jgi:hypothetical protein
VLGHSSIAITLDTYSYVIRGSGMLRLMPWKTRWATFPQSSQDRVCAINLAIDTLDLGSYLPLRMKERIEADLNDDVA